MPNNNKIMDEPNVKYHNLILSELFIPKFIKYLLLSRNYIEKSKLLMYGKRHPQIHIFDLLNIKVPCPDLSIQKKIVDEISRKEEINLKKQQKIKKL